MSDMTRQEEIDLVKRKKMNDTRNETINMLKKEGKCAVIRPTGLGKTYILCNICAQEYANVLYIVPGSQVKGQVEKYMKLWKDEDTEENSANNVLSIITYRRLGEYYQNDKEKLVKRIKKNYNLIVFDEMHHMGANIPREAIQYILENIDVHKTNIVGATATPVRMDAFDAVDEFFDNNVTSFYGLDKAISDGLIKSPIYIYAPGDKDRILQRLASKYSGNYKKTVDGKEVDILDSIHRNLILKCSKIMNASNIIKESVSLAYEETPSYMKFMVFFPTIENLESKQGEVIKWFKEAYKDKQVNFITLHSKNKGKNDESSIKMVQDLDSVESKKQHKDKIDLILSVNMLNEGYHVPDITGVVLLRPTQSSIVYTQQVGRCLSVGMKNTPIVIDFVNNLNTKALYDQSIGAVSDVDSTVKLDVKEQCKRLNNISSSNLTMINKVAEVKRVIQKIEGTIGIGDQEKIIGYYTCDMPIHIICKKTKLPSTVVMGIIENMKRIGRSV